MNKKTHSKEAVSVLFKKYFKYSENQKSLIFTFMTLCIVGNLILLAGPILFGRMLSEIQYNGVSPKNISVVLIFMGLLLFKDFFFWMLHGPARVIERIVAFKIANFYRRFLLEGILKKDSLWHNEHDSGDTINKVQKSTEGLQNFGENIFQILQAVVRLLGTALILFFYSPWIAIFVFTLSVLTLRLIYSFDKILLPQYDELNKYSNKSSASLFDALSNITTVKILNIEKIVGHGVLKRFFDPLKIFFANVKLNEWKWFTVNMCFQVVSIVPLACYIIYKIVNTQNLDVGRISTLYLYLSELIFVFFSFGSFYEQMCLYRNGVMNAEPIENEVFKNKNCDRKNLNFKTVLDIKNLNFSYDSSEKSPGIKEAELIIRKGQKIAVIGASGSGKTTLLKAIHGLFPTATASVSVDNAPFEQMNLSHINLSTMLVPQEPEIFSATILENLTLGLDYSEVEIENALQIAQFSDVIATLPKGLDSLVNEKGVNLSGGQKQRLALARALLFAAQKDFILLDESTSSVDPENEAKIYKGLLDIKEKTFLASIHKMNLLKFFDYILIVDDNRIINKGTFEELLSHDESFRKIWDDFVKVQERIKTPLPTGLMQSPNVAYNSPLSL